MNGSIYIMNIDQKLFKNTLLFLVLAEVLSLASFVFPVLNTIGFGLVIVAALVLSLKKLEWGLGLALVELIIGSFGQIFSLDIGGFTLSVRIALFLVIMSVYALRELQQWLATKECSLTPFVRSQVGKWYVGLTVILAVSLAQGLLRNSFGNAFFDFNNWLYFLYILPVIRVAHKNLGSLVTTLSFVAVLTLAVKTLVLEYFFAHNIPGTIKMLYQWTRDYRFGEITFYAQNFYRVFLQSHLWLLFAFFVLLGVHSFQDKTQNTKLLRYTFFFITVALVISFSRSLWVGWVVGTGLFGLLLLVKAKWPFWKTLKWGSGVVGVLITAVVFIFALINIPPVKTDTGLGNLLSDRLTVIEAAGSSRINLLEPLVTKIKMSPVLGSGFGSTVTYDSVDPRNLASTAGASGEYTTYAFEWGYLDLLLKLGIVGTLVYVGLLMFLLKTLYTQIDFRSKIYDLRFGLFVSLAALMAVHVFTPYLNHPLGIGFVVLITGYVFSQREVTS